ncbi:MAG: ATP-grasp domain-containing protein [Sphingobacteriales bacterium]|nr:ATP-grasp domain-containing protein [Sphingobacteriales bacterium]
MLSSSPLSLPLPANQLFVWVLAPYLESSDDNINYYYDFSQSIDEYTRTFESLGVAWKWQPVTMNDYASVINNIINENESDSRTHIVFNICDGDEVNGTPGISVVRLLEASGLIYTGSDEYFYEITTSKIPMKNAFDQAGVPTPDWEAIHSRTQNLKGITEKLGVPLIVKPSVSGGSMGVGIRNVVSSESEMNEQVQQMFDGYRGWQLTSDGIIAESFINGPEYTVLIVGSYDEPETARVYEPVERIFHPSLPDKEKFLSFDRLWEIYEEETEMPEQGNFYEYQVPDAALVEQIKKISWDAYVATKGTGYTRADVRMDKDSKKMYVLEVNAQCGLSEDENYTSIGAILRLSDNSFSDLVVAIIHDAYQRKRVANNCKGPA